MHIPRIWAKANADVASPENQPLALVAWGFGNDEAEAKREAANRLDRMVERVRRGEPFPERYAYGSRPLREEILQTIDAVGESEPRAILTRNAYGVTVLNTARLLFLDIDTGPVEEGLGQKLGRLFGGGSKEDSVLTRLRETLRNAGKGTFRIYRTAGGYRALAVDREFDPAGREAQDLMKATNTDPQFVRLCNVQKSFRARLTPKPWRMGLKAPPGDYPRDAATQRRFEEWLGEYGRESSKHATCKFLESVSKAAFGGIDDNELVAIHDRMTRATESLPLA